MFSLQRNFFKTIMEEPILDLAQMGAYCTALCFAANTVPLSLLYFALYLHRTYILNQTQNKH